MIEFVHVIVTCIHNQISFNNAPFVPTELFCFILLDPFNSVLDAKFGQCRSHCMTRTTQRYRQVIYSFGSRKLAFVFVPYTAVDWIENGHLIGNRSKKFFISEKTHWTLPEMRENVLRWAGFESEQLSIVTTTNGEKSRKNRKRNMERNRIMDKTQWWFKEKLNRKS